MKLITIIVVLGALALIFGEGFTSVINLQAQNLIPEGTTKEQIKLIVIIGTIAIIAFFKGKGK